MRKVEFVFHQTNIVWNDKLLRTIYLSGTFYQHFCKLKIAHHTSDQFVNEFYKTSKKHYTVRRFEK